MNSKAKQNHGVHYLPKWFTGEIKETRVGHDKYLRLGVRGIEFNNGFIVVEKFFGVPKIEAVETPKTLEDNRGVVLSVNGTGHTPSNNKHVDIKEKNVQLRVQPEMSVEPVGTEDNVADFITKGLTRIPFERHFPYLGFEGEFMIRAIRAIGPSASL